MAEAKKKAGEHTYYAKGMGAGFYVPLLDADGKKVPVLDKRGNQLFLHGKAAFRDRSVTLQPVVTNAKIGTYCALVTSDPAEIAAAEACVADPQSPIMSEAQWRKSLNADAFEADERARVAEEKAARAEKAAAEQAEEIAKLKAELGAAKRGGGLSKN